MNKVVLIGRLTKDPELKFTPGNGTAVANITLAVDKKQKNDDGSREADFISIIIWGKQAEATANYMTKGRLMGVSGRIQTRSYEKDGSRRYVTEVVADEVQFLDSKREGGNQQQNGNFNNGNYQNGNGNFNNNNGGNNNYGGYGNEITPIDDGDIPF